jgi:hypothetical protein
VSSNPSGISPVEFKAIIKTVPTGGAIPETSAPPES